MRKIGRLTAQNFYDDQDMLRFLYTYDIEFKQFSEHDHRYEIILREGMKDEIEIYKGLQRYYNEQKFTGFNLLDIGEIFSEEELSKAEWIDIDIASRFRYAIPAEHLDYRNLYFQTVIGCEKCKEAKAYRQVDNFRLEKDLYFPLTRNITGLLNVWDELFVNEKSKEWLENSDLKGFEVRKVYNKDKTEVLKNTFQLYITDQLKESMEEISYRKKEICPECGNEYCTIGEEWPQPVYRREVFKDINVDIIKTKERIGYIMYKPHILISQRMYRFLKEYDMVRHFSMNIVKLVD